MAASTVSVHAPAFKSPLARGAQQFTIQREGLAEILIPQNKSSSRKSKDGEKDAPDTITNAQGVPQSVFYNPIQQFNRDLSVLAIKAYAEDWLFLQQEHNARQLKLPSKNRGPRKRKRKAEEIGQEDSAAEKRQALLPLPAEYSLVSTKPTEILARDDNSKGNGGSDQLVPESAILGKLEDEDYTQNAQGEDVLADPYGVDGTKDGVSSTTMPTPFDSNKKGDGQSIPKPPFVVLDALSATGLRALRYAKEIPEITTINANDISSSALEAIRKNVQQNGLANKITTTKADAIEHMHSVASSIGTPPRLYQVIDLDPYGTAAPFFDAAVQALANGGLLLVTCTDAGVFASVGYLEKTFSQYGGLPVKGPHSHEAGLRLILHAIATSAARYGIAVEPLLSLSVDYYARVIVRLRKSPADVKLLASKSMFIYNCDQGCGAWEKQFMAQARPKENKHGEILYKFTSSLGPEAGRDCDHCGFRTHLAGPMWGGPLHNPYYINRILQMLPELDPSTYQTLDRIEGVLTNALEECFEDPWAPLNASPRAPESEPQISDQHPPEHGVTESNSRGPQIASNGQVQNKPQLSSSPSSSRPIPPLPPHFRANHPFFIHPPSLARALGVPTTSDAELRGALRHLGYRATRSHTKPGSIVTDASWDVIWEIMREWIRQKGIRINPRPGTCAWGLMQKDRARSRVENFKEDLSQGLKGVQTVEQLREELEAGLARLTGLVDGSLDKSNQEDIIEDTKTSNVSSKAHDKNRRGREVKSRRPPFLNLHNLDIKFDEALGTDEPLTSGTKPRGKKVTRYAINPANWGPLSRARGP